MQTDIIYDGVKTVLSSLIRKLRSKNKYLAIIANKESIARDAEEFFSGFKVIFRYVKEEFNLDQRNIEYLVSLLDSAIRSQTNRNDTVVLVLAGPCILYAFIADRLHNSSRNILYAQFDLKEKVYRLYSIP